MTHRVETAHLRRHHTTTTRLSAADRQLSETSSMFVAPVRRQRRFWHSPAPGKKRHLAPRNSGRFVGGHSYPLPATPRLPNDRAVPCPRSTGWRGARWGLLRRQQSSTTAAAAATIDCYRVAGERPVRVFTAYCVMRRVSLRSPLVRAPYTLLRRNSCATFTGVLARLSRFVYFVKVRACVRVCVCVRVYVYAGPVTVRSANGSTFEFWLFFFFCLARSSSYTARYRYSDSRYHLFLSNEPIVIYRHYLERYTLILIRLWWIPLITGNTAAVRIPSDRPADDVQMTGVSVTLPKRLF